MSLFKKHQQAIERAIQALKERTFYANWQEHPSPKVYGENADKEGRETFQASVGSNYDKLYSEGSTGWIGEEFSPYLNKKLDIKYPAFSASTLIENAVSVRKQWKNTKPEERAGILMESLSRFASRFFENAYATMHTTGQGYMMAFQASGPHAADRALEAIALGLEELKRYPEEAVWDKPMGKYNIILKKNWKPIPKGIGLVVGCSTFPTWNSVPGMYASLITGNPVIIKPHPGAILPIAILVQELQDVLKEEGLSPLVCQLAVDTLEDPITKKLAEDDNVKLIDYTGGSVFGNYIESLEGKTTFTEKTGINSVIIDSVENADKAAQNIAFSLALYSGQMCTAPQNILIPKDGVESPDGKISFEDFVEKIAANTKGLVENPKAGPFVLGTIQNERTLDRTRVTNIGDVVLKEDSIENPMFSDARVMSPRIVSADSKDLEKLSEEIFGPFAAIIKTENTAQSIELASKWAAEKGAISCLAYSTDENVRNEIAEAMEDSFTNVSFNLTGGIYVNQNAAFSDFHVTGGNPSGNASFTSPEFLVKRFIWVGTRIPS